MYPSSRNWPEETAGSVHPPVSDKSVRPTEWLTPGRCSSRREDEVLPLLRIGDQARLQWIVPHVIPLLVVFALVANDSIEILLLPDGSRRSEELIDPPRADALERFHDVRQLVPDA